MNPMTEPVRIYIIRHATPDWSRKDIPYDRPPGPPLVEQGEKEAVLLGDFIRQQGLKKLYHSPLERTKRTAQISARLAGIEIQEENSLAEWRSDEGDAQVAARMLLTWENLVREAAQIGPLGFVSHGGPVMLLLRRLGMSADVLEFHRRAYDHANPMPPAGVWLAQREDGATDWELSLVFIPRV